MTNATSRHVLLLQGPSSRFFAQLGVAFQDRGARVTRVGFCPGDRLYWSRRSGEYVAYRGRPAEWKTYVSQLIEARGITDVVMLGDGRSVHKDAVSACQLVSTQPVPWSVEHGYLRPSMLSVEPWGTGGRSRLMAQFDPSLQADWEPPKYQSSFRNYALMDTTYHIANLLGSWLLYPRYRNHALEPQYREWAGWIRKGLTTARRRRAARDAEGKIANLSQFFVFPLQLETDYQIRDHAPEGGVLGAMERTIRSFAVDAKPSAHLVIKAHPMDNGLFDWQAHMVKIAARNGVAQRVHFLDGGDLEALLEKSAGCVTINSTVGLTAALMGCPVHPIGTAVYAREGVTHAGDLASFFERAARPDPTKVAQFLRYLKATVLVPGSFDGEGSKPGAAKVADKILAGPIFEREPF